jgi:hypothetical protein
MHDPRVWYHVMFSTYGTWLYGDRRGFRTRHHREHVDGDYKHPPPPGRYARQEQRSRAALKQPPVVLPDLLRGIVGRALKERLEGLGALVVVVAVADQHVHLLARILRGEVREWIGTAKRHAWFVLRDHGWHGKLWGKRWKKIPIVTRQHQLNVFGYIARHAGHGAWVWKWGDPL